MTDRVHCKCNDGVHCKCTDGVHCKCNDGVHCKCNDGVHGVSAIMVGIVQVCLSVGLPVL